MSTEAQHEANVSRLRQEAEASTESADPLIAYFAGWVVFYIDQYAELRDAWRRSLDERAASLRAD